jgi:hypothetical protein
MKEQPGLHRQQQQRQDDREDDGELQAHRSPLTIAVARRESVLPSGALLTSAPDPFRIHG